SLIPLCPARCTVFPYTTLFRSNWSRRLSKIYARQLLEYVGKILKLQRPDREVVPLRRVLAFGLLIAMLGGCVRVDKPRQAPVPEDRKSTRLNSSHVKISYAVFC